ncbi:MAG: UDP-N-acetylmuramate--L-alanine ligase [Fretibacterium sp.]|nr:UDP-N-acetylmuramate--L-alanine ligase [Fretibacterium sp.]
MAELSGVKRIHLMGINGAGMSSLAKLLSGLGYEVSGCDLERGHYLEEVEALGVVCRIGHARNHIDQFKPDLLIYSSAVRQNCEELSAAREKGIRTVRRGEALSWLFNAAEGVGVAGTHGKTTTSSMAGLIFSRAGLSPTLYVGGEMRDMGTNAVLGTGPRNLFVSELDESDGSFELFHPALTMITNVDWDHVDHFASKDEVVAAFVRFARGRKPGAPLVVCAEDDGTRKMLQILAEQGDTGPVLRYGWGTSWEWGAFDLTPKPGGGSLCHVCHEGKELGTLELAVSGEHNVLNALAALAASDALGVPFETAAAILSDFHGAARRLQVMGEKDGILVMDDYAHHPTEAAATLSAVRGAYPDRRLLLVYQPHRYTRTAAFAGALASVLSRADEVFLLPIYSAGEEALPAVSSEDIARRINEAGGHGTVCSGMEEAADRLRIRARAGDLVLTMGAGNVFHVGEMFLSKSLGYPDFTNKYIM